MLSQCLLNAVVVAGSIAGQGQPVLAAPTLGPVPAYVLPAPTVLLPAPPLKLCDFARAFVPIPGCYEVVFCHPVSGCPVKVCFDLPPGCPRLHVHKRSLEFDYGCKSVTIRFQLLHSKVKVKYS